MASCRPITWPGGKRFAFTIVDDTDWATVDRVGPIYAFLRDHGFLTTKTVWPLAPVATPLHGGETLEEPRYREWVAALKRDGFEIAFHGATAHPSPRERTIRALDYFRQTLGEDPKTYCMHVGQIEAVYWGRARLDGFAARFYSSTRRLLGRQTLYQGHVQGSPHFWGDVCRERITYVRNLIFRDINTLRADPMMPCHDPRRPFVRYWFSASDGTDEPTFSALLQERNQDRLVEEGGACIVYTHFGKDFLENGRLQPEFARRMRRLASLPGWFVPASTLLDHLREQPHWTEKVDHRRLHRMQWQWLLRKLRHGTT